MRRINPWVLVTIVVLVVLSAFIDSFGFIYRGFNHIPLNAGMKEHPRISLPLFGDVDLYVHRGLDLQGGTRLILQLDKSHLPAGKTLKDAQDATVNIITTRVNALGLSEPLVEPQGTDRIEVDLPGVGLQQAIALVGKTARLEFYKWKPDPAIQGFGFRPQHFGLTGDQLTDATVGTDQVGAPDVELTFNDQGANLFDSATQEAITKQGHDRNIPAFLDLTDEQIAAWDDPKVRNTAMRKYSEGGNLLTDPYIQERIPGGKAQITGGFTPDQARQLVISLKSGALPTKVTPIEEEEVGPTLGNTYVKRSLAAGLFGLVAVILFLLAYYRLPGLVAALALILYAMITLALYKLLNSYVTITLAGMAGFILSVGMAVDANVLIFERLKEEVRAGRTLGAAVDAGWKRAWPAIRDSNVSTLITCLVLYLATTGGVRGFAVTLALGVMLSMFTAVVVSRNLLLLVLDAVGRPSNRALGISGAPVGRSS